MATAFEGFGESHLDFVESGKKPTFNEDRM